MKKAMFFVFAAMIALSACKAPDSAGGAASGAADKDLSYAFGLYVGTQIKGFNVPINYDEFVKGVKAYLQDEETRMTMDNAMLKIEEAYLATVEREKIESLAAEKAFFEENLAKPGVEATPSGLQYEVITEGSGPKPQITDTVKVNYEGSLPDGTVFDSSYNRGEPVEFPLNQVIPGWSEGLQLMNEGSTYRLFIPSELGYGESGIRDIIPPNSPLIFKVELLSIVK